MMNVYVVGAVLAMSLAAPADPAKPKPPKAKAGETAKPPEKAKAPKPASKAALADAKAALLGPCSPEMASAKVTSVTVIDGNKLNELIAKDKLDLPKAYPTALFLNVTYQNGGESGSDYCQITTHYQLTTNRRRC